MESDGVSIDNWFGISCNSFGTPTTEKKANKKGLSVLEILEALRRMWVVAFGAYAALPTAAGNPVHAEFVDMLVKICSLELQVCLPDPTGGPLSSYSFRENDSISMGWSRRERGGEGKGARTGFGNQGGRSVGQLGWCEAGGSKNWSDGRGWGRGKMYTQDCAGQGVPEEGWREGRGIREKVERALGRSDIGIRGRRDRNTDDRDDHDSTDFGR
eukprot:Rmarinus@m.7140